MSVGVSFQFSLWKRGSAWGKGMLQEKQKNMPYIPEWTQNSSWHMVGSLNRHLLNERRDAGHIHPAVGTEENGWIIGMECRQPGFGLSSPAS